MRLISVAYRPAAQTPMAAQSPQNGIWHQDKGGAAPNRTPLPHAGEASQTPPEGGASRPQGRKNQSHSPCKPNRTACRTKNQQKGSKPLGLPPALFRKNLQLQFTTSPLQPPAIPAPEHTQGKATLPQQRPCQKAASRRATRSRRQHPRAWKARAARQGSAKACRHP